MTAALEVDVLREQLAYLSEGMSELELRMETGEQRVAELAAMASLATFKVTTMTEIAFFGRRAQANHLTAITNLVLAFDLPPDWWRRRQALPLGEWWKILNTDVEEFRYEHGIGK